MSGQHEVSPVEDLIQYKKRVLLDERRDSRIRGDVEATLEFINKRNSYFSNQSQTDRSHTPLDNSQTAGTALQNNSMPYPQQIAMSMQPYDMANQSRPTLHSAQNSIYSYGSSDSIMLQKEKQMSGGAGGPPTDVYAGYTPEESHDAHAPVGKVGLRERIKHFTFAWFACTMSTGGLAFTMSVVPNRFEGLTAFGTVLFVFNIILFLTFTTIQVIRFIMHPDALSHAFTNPHEGFFFATFWLTLATMITNTTAYGIPNTGPWLIDALRVAFWIYTVIVTLIAILYYYLLFNVKALVITNVLPGWVLPIFPAMLVGTLASAIAKTQPPEYAAAMLVTGFTYQGLGFMVAMMMYGLYFGRLLTQGLPVPASRPAMMIAVGPPAFTSLALIGMAQDIQVLGLFTNVLPLQGIQNQALIPDILSLAAILVAIFLWMWSFWFFVLAVMAFIEAIPRNDFHLNWYALVFPNVGFTIATIKIGERLNNSAIGAIGTGMAVSLFLMWLLVVYCHIRAVVNHVIMWPGRDEDAAH
ncbi:C4-dicarboxylate transporter/malic acid transporter [Phlyctema vagabunda]|uniref:C4-dicarboxylate transporter/malic acid transporter n=1 Tax=Phlyctema vagabunda TaxID=108571 RepID=A0ABR4PL58_9HELO